MKKALLHDTLLDTAARFPSKPAIVTQNDETCSYSELLSSALALAAQLESLQLRSGERVGIYLPKSLLSAVFPYAASFLGVVFVPINHLLRSQQLAHVMRDSGAKVLVTSEAKLVQCIAELQSCPQLEAIVTESDTGAIESNRLDLSAWVGIVKHAPKLRERSDSTTLAALMYTSGSTGAPKGVMISHENLLDGIEAVADYLHIDEHDRILAVLPFSFDYGLNQLTSAIRCGATCVLMEYLLPRDIIKAIVRYSITGLAGVPTIWHQLAGLAWPDGERQTLRYFTNTGGRLPSTTLEKIRRLFPGADPIMMYGLTEAFRSTYLPSELVDERAGSIGRAIPGAEILVINGDKEIAQPHEPGELVHCGRHVTLGYWQNEAATQARFRPVPGRTTKEGRPEIGVWSGDIVESDEQGFLYFLGRLDGMIKTSGYRVSPEEVEEVAYQTNGVVHAAAFGVDDELLGQAIVLAVVFAPDSDCEGAQIFLKCREKLPNYMVPRDIVAVSDMPFNSNGKIDRLEVANRFVSNRGEFRQVDAGL